jgi:hypothetical protein
MMGLLELKSVLGTKKWLIYIACLSLFAVWCLVILVLALTIF